MRTLAGARAYRILKRLDVATGETTFRAQTCCPCGADIMSDSWQPSMRGAVDTTGALLREHERACACTRV